MIDILSYCQGSCYNGVGIQQNEYNFPTSTACAYSKSQGHKVRGYVCVTGENLNGRRIIYRNFGDRTVNSVQNGSVYIISF